MPVIHEFEFLLKVNLLGIRDVHAGEVLRKVCMGGDHSAVHHRNQI